MKRAMLVFGFFVLLAGITCSQSTSNSLVVVTVSAAPAMSAVVQLRAVLTNAGVSDTDLFPQTVSSTPITFDTTFGVSLSKARNGQLDIAVEALDALAKVVASGSGNVAINVGGRADVTVQLVVDSGADAGAPDGSARDVATDRLPSNPDVVNDVRGNGGTMGTGGAIGTGGTIGTGGATGTGGIMGTGGTIGTGGATGTGGMIGTGGVRGTGGVTGTGGIVGTGGATGTGGSSSTTTSTKSPIGTSCSSNGQCASGYCTDGVCCGVADCNGQGTNCATCSSSTNGVPNGQCGARCQVCNCINGVCSC